jgi:hypothetical protein
MKAPTYKRAKDLVRILNKHFILNNHNNVFNSTDLAIDLTNLNINKNHKLITYDIKDLSVNIPIEETLTTTKSRLLKINDTQTTKQIITLMRLALSQNYFTFQNKVYQLGKGVYMGSTILSTITEISQQYFEDIHIKHFLDTKNILFYIPYADDTLIIHGTKITHHDLINTHINQIHTNIKLDSTYENNGCISFLDLLVIQKPSNLETDIFRKPATTNTNINFFSNHRIEHKIAAFRYHITRIHSLPLTPRRNQKNGH